MPPMPMLRKDCNANKRGLKGAVKGAGVCDSRDLVTRVNYSEMSIREVARDSNR